MCVMLLLADLQRNESVQNQIANETGKEWWLS